MENAGELGVCVGISTDAHRCEVFTGLRNEDDGLGDVGALDGDSITALTLYALRPFMLSLFISDGFLGLCSAGDIRGRSIKEHTGRISATTGVGEGVDDVEVRRNLKGFLALIEKLAVIGRFLTWICSGICGSSNSGGRFFRGGRSPRSDSGDEHNVKSPDENEAVVQVIFSPGRRGCCTSRLVLESREKETCRSTFSRESNGRVMIGLGRGGRRGVCSVTFASGAGLLSGTKGSHRMH